MDWKPRAQALAQQLADAGHLTDPAWRAAFQEVPRHVFVPAFYPISDDGSVGKLLTADDADVWLDAVYRDAPLVTQRRPITPGSDDQWPTSSSTMPELMAVMLDRLDVRDGYRVLEIGTGTGYNAALLCHRLDSGNVVSVDIDPELVDAARERLDEAGYGGALLAARDGAAGYAEEAPFDRIIATCSVNHVPPAWIDQLAPGGRIIAPLGEFYGALVVLDKTNDDEVNGHIDPYPVSFMPLRERVDTSPSHVLGYDGTGLGHHGTTDIDPAMFDASNHDLMLLAQLHLPGLMAGAGERDDGSQFLMLATKAGVARVYLIPQDGRWTVEQHGARLWDTAEHVARLWDLLGKPARTRYGIGVLNDRQYVSLDDPDSRYAWELPM